MSVISLAAAKAYLKVIHSGDDDLIQELLDGAERQALDFLDRETFNETTEFDTEFDSDEAVDIATYDMPSSTRTAIFKILEADYKANPDDAEKLKEAARDMLAPFRDKLGV